MSTVDTGADKPTDCESVAQSVEQAFSSLAGVLVDHTELPESERDTIEGIGESLSRDVQALEGDGAGEEIDELEERVESNEEELQSHDGKISDHLESIVSLEIEVEEHLSGDVEGSSSTEETPLYRPETPLENICALPEHMVSSELSASQERARFLSRDVRDYGKKVPAGWVIDSGSIKKVLSAKEEGTIYWTQVSRVIEWIDRLGKDGTKIVERNGSRKVCFTEECVERLERLSTDTDVSPNKQGALG